MTRVFSHWLSNWRLRTDVKPLEAHQTTSPRPHFSPNFLQLRNAGLVVAAASVAAANPIEYRLGIFLRIHHNIHEGVSTINLRQKGYWETWTLGVGLTITNVSFISHFAYPFGAQQKSILDNLWGAGGTKARAHVCLFLHDKPLRTQSDKPLRTRPLPGTSCCAPPLAHNPLRTPAPARAQPVARPAPPFAQPVAHAPPPNFAHTPLRATHTIYTKLL